MFFVLQEQSDSFVLDLLLGAAPPPLLGAARPPYLGGFNWRNVGGLAGCAGGKGNIYPERSTCCSA